MVWLYKPDKTSVLSGLLVGVVVMGLFSVRLVRFLLRQQKLGELLFGREIVIEPGRIKLARSLFAFAQSDPGDSHYLYIDLGPSTTFTRRLYRCRFVYELSDLNTSVCLEARDLGRYELTFSHVLKTHGAKVRLYGEVN